MLTGCFLFGGGGLSAVGAPVDAADARVAGLQAISLDRRPELLSELTLPQESRGEVPEYVEIPASAWKLVSTVGKARMWEAPLPVRPRTLFFHRPPDDMALHQREDVAAPWSKARQLAHKAGIEDADDVATWEFSTHAVRVRRLASNGRPRDGEYAVTYSKAVEREHDLHPDLFEGEEEEFVFRSAQVDDTTRHGLYLPAPARAVFEVEVPEGAVFDLSPGILPPEATPPGARSDGAELIVAIDGQEVARQPVHVGWFDDLRVDLSAWAGQQVQLSLQVDPGDSAELDYVFVATPTVHRPMAAPPRVVIVFIDTMRQDGMSLYGYERPTSPHLDAWAEDAAVFETARSVAPWTLPSTRAMFLGDQPERWDAQTTLQERAAQAGWATAFMSGNVYLSSNFAMDRGWGTHRCINWPTADIQVDRALEWLDAHPDRAALLTLHFMDMHLPYTEPRAYRRIWAGDRPAVLSSDDFQRKEVVADVRKLGDDGKQYVRDRYDQNLRFIDDELHRFMQALGPDDTVVIMADHGEEFWDHNGFEHGHTLYEELLRVPLVVKGPGLAAGRYDAPVSLMDIAPTLARVMGLDDDGMFGMPLQGVADGTAAAAFAARPVGIGRPLYGNRAWGVISRDHKYWAEDGRERLYDLATDPGEGRDLVARSGASTEPWRHDLGPGVDRPAAVALRIEGMREQSDRPLSVRVVVPGGIAEAWAGDDPLDYSTLSVEKRGEDEVVFTWGGKSRGSREAYVLPRAPIEEVAGSVQVFGRTTGAEAAVAPSADLAALGPYVGRRDVLWRGSVGGRRFEIDRTVAPVADTSRTALSGVDSELAEDLKALGYWDE
ncbi:MAG: sulfatase [Alphaproteobacteria bacterium]|nr:sulfatase [Alphaproteobacteria bacterium]